MSGGPKRVAVAVSGGRDSTALLHCTGRVACALGVDVVALHVNHGLLAAADDWLAQCGAPSLGWARIIMLNLSLRPAKALAWARSER